MLDWFGYDIFLGVKSVISIKENHVSVIVKQEATIKLLASPGSQPFLPSLPRVNSTRGYCSSVATSPSQS